jgi:hypothetical protein
MNIELSESSISSLDELIQDVVCKVDCIFFRQSNWSILTIPLQKKTNKILFCIPGFSENSFNSFVKKIKNGVDYISDKYDYIIIVKFGKDAKDEQNRRLNGIRPEDKCEVENNLYKELALVCSKIINNLKIVYSDYKFDVLGYV